LTLAAAFTAMASPSQAQDATAQAVAPAELLRRAYDNLYAADVVQVVRLTSRSKGGQPVSRTVRIVRKQSSPPPRTLVRFLEPPDVRGTSLLLIEEPGRLPDLFLYLPAFQRTRRISAAQRSDSFFGTNVTYEDLEPKRASDFHVRSLGLDQVGDVVCLRLELRPRDGYDSQYDRIVSCIEPERAVVLRSDYERDGRAIKRMDCEADSLREINGRFVPFLAKVRSQPSSFETEIAIQSYDVKPAIPDSVFTIVHLETPSELAPVREPSDPR
jgi:hypothetical protein